MAIGALASASSILAKESPQIGSSFPVEGREPAEYLNAATKASSPLLLLAHNATKDNGELREKKICPLLAVIWKVTLYSDC